MRLVYFLNILSSLNKDIIIIIIIIIIINVMFVHAYVLCIFYEKDCVKRLFFCKYIFSILRK